MGVIPVSRMKVVAWPPAPWGTVRAPGQARVRLDAGGRARIQVDLQDIGTGSPTVFRQLAAAELGLPVDAVDIDWGDSRLPATSPLYSSSGTLHTGSAVALACRDICRRLAPRPGEDTLAALRRRGESEISAEGSFTLPGDAPIDFDGGDGEYAMRTFGAVFVEVGVDPDLGLVRLRRAVGAYSCGRVLNERTARAQMIGGIVWGWGKATMEASQQDPASGRWLSKNLSAVHVPVNADIPADIRVHFTDEYDPHASPIGVRGMGEIGATGGRGGRRRRGLRRRRGTPAGPAVQSRTTARRPSPAVRPRPAGPGGGPGAAGAAEV